MTKAELAQALKIAPTTVDEWLHRGCPAKRGRRGFELDLAAVVAWLRKEAAKRAEDDEIDPKEARRRLDIARAELAREQRAKVALEVKRRSGELVEVSQVEVVWARLVGACRSRLLGIPSKLAPMLIGLSSTAVVQARIMDEVHDALRELSSERTLDPVFADLEENDGIPDDAGGAAQDA